MSNLVVNKLSEFLSKVIKDYTKEHLNVSLLKGEIFLKDFEVDVNVINVYVEFYVPFLYITKASVSDVKLSLPDVFHLSAKPTVIQIGSVSIECQQRDFSKPSARDLLGDDDFLLTASADDNEFRIFPADYTPNKFNKTTISVPTLYFPVHSPLILAQRVNALIH